VRSLVRGVESAIPQGAALWRKIKVRSPHGAPLLVDRQSLRVATPFFMMGKAIVAEKVDPFKGDLYRYLNVEQIDGFENFGRVIPESEMPKLESALV